MQTCEAECTVLLHNQRATTVPRCNHVLSASEYYVHQSFTLGRSQKVEIRFRQETGIAKRNSKLERPKKKRFHPCSAVNARRKPGYSPQNGQFQNNEKSESSTTGHEQTNTKAAPAPSKQFRKDFIPPHLYEQQTLVISRFFNSFLPRNSFTGTDTNSAYLKNHLFVSDALYYAAYALGSLSPTNSGESTTPGSKTEALEAYNLGCEFMTANLRSASEHDWALILETTLLLGLFELAYSYRGVGWRRHFDFGSRESLKKLGPMSCFSESGQRLFQRFRLIEITSSMIFASKSFLASQPWQEVSDAMASNRPPSLKETMLNLSTVCSSLCLSAADLAFSVDNPVADEDQIRLSQMAKDGMRMRILLKQWEVAAKSDTNTVCVEDSIIGWTMLHTMSLYLHTSFAVNNLWARQQFAIPVLSAPSIRVHVDAIIELVAKALSSSSICPVVFLASLYVASASAKFVSQRKLILDQLGQIRKRYVIAQACMQQISTYWAMDGILKSTNCPYPILRHHRYMLLGHLKNELAEV